MSCWLCTFIQKTVVLHDFTSIAGQLRMSSPCFSELIEPGGPEGTMLMLMCVRMQRQRKR